MAWALQLLLFGWGLRLCFPIGWWLWLVSMLRKAADRSLCSDRLLAMLWNQTDYRLCPKVGQGLRLHFTIR